MSGRMSLTKQTSRSPDVDFGGGGTGAGLGQCFAMHSIAACWWRSTWRWGNGGAEVIAGRSRATWSGGSETAAPAVAQPLSATAGVGRQTWSATCPTTLTVEIDEMKYGVIILQHSFSVQEAKAFL